MKFSPHRLLPTKALPLPASFPYVNLSFPILSSLTDEKAVFERWPLKDPLLNISVIPTQHFTGRNKILSEITDAFKKLAESSMQQRIMILHGLGGVGKTQIALSYIYSNKSSYKTILWIDSGNEQSIFRNFRLIAQRLLEWAGNTRLQTPVLNYTRVAFELGLDQYCSTEGYGRLIQSADGRGVSDAVLCWLEQEENSGWLIIFDAADDLEDFDLTSSFPNTPIATS